MKLIALDLDGTTLNSKKEMAPETVLTIQQAQQQGHIVMAMSGRPYKSIKNTLDTYGLMCPIGANNGTALYINDKLTYLTTLSSAQATTAVSIINQERVPFNFATTHGSFAPSEWDTRLEEVLASGRVPDSHKTNQHFKMFTTSPHVYGHTIFNQFSEVLAIKDLQILKVLILTLDPVQKDRMYQALSMIKDVTVTSSSPFNLEMTHALGSKGQGLKLMAKHYGIPMSETIAIGDEMNDVPMFQVAGLAIAMGNAEDEVKQHSHVVTLTNDEHGVAHAIKKYVLNNNL